MNLYPLVHTRARRTQCLAGDAKSQAPEGWGVILLEERSISLKPIKYIAIITMLALPISACTNQQIGAFTGSLMGAGIGVAATKDKKKSTRVAAGLIGAASGAVLGGTIGYYMDEADKKKLTRAMTELPSNKKRNWTNKRTGTDFTIKPISNVSRDNKGRYRQAHIWGRKKGSKKLVSEKHKVYF